MSPPRSSTSYEFSNNGGLATPKLANWAIHFWILMASNVSSSHGMGKFMKVSELGALKANNSRIHVALEGRYISVHSRYPREAVCNRLGLLSHGWSFDNRGY